MAIASDLSGIEVAVMCASTDPDAWQGVANALAAAFPGTRPNLSDYSLTRGSVTAAYHTFDDSYMHSYYAHFGTVMPGLQAWTSSPVGRIARFTEFVPERDLLRTEFWNDWMRPQNDLQQTLLSVLHRDAGRQVLFGVPIERRAASHVMAPLVRAVRHLQPLMQHALGINRMLLGHKLDAVLLRQGVEPTKAAVLLLSPQGVILFANARAERMLTEGQLIRHDHRGRLSFAHPAGTVRLEAALRSPSPLAALTAGSAFRLGAGDHAQEVRLMPLPPEAIARLGVPFLPVASRLGFLVAVSPVRPAEDRVQRIVAKLGLTRAEAAIALAFVEGATLAEIADARGVSVNTVRNQVKSTIAKAGLRRQVDLVRLIQGLDRQV